MTWSSYCEEDVEEWMRENELIAKAVLTATVLSPVTSPWNSAPRWNHQTHKMFRQQHCFNNRTYIAKMYIQYPIWMELMKSVLLTLKIWRVVQCWWVIQYWWVVWQWWVVQYCQVVPKSIVSTEILPSHRNCQ